MTAETKKTFIMLAGALGVALITVVTTLVIQKIQQPPVAPAPDPAPIVAEVTPPPAPVAQIISIKPHFVDITVPHKQCHDEPRMVYQNQSGTKLPIGAAVGGVAGGMIGHSIGGDDNAKLIASAAGAAIGALSGSAVQKNMHHPQAQTVYTRICSTYKTTKHEQKGYEVTYMFEGQQGTVVMENPPVGNTLSLPIQGSA